MIGFEHKLDSVELRQGENIMNIILIEKATSLGTVEIYADKKDIAKEVMKAVIDNKKDIRASYENYECNTYIKTSLEKEPRFPGLLNPKDGAAPRGREKMNFIESYSVTHYKRQNTYLEEIIAHQDYSEKVNSEVEVNVNFSDANSVLPSQRIEYNPYVFFEKVEDGDIDPYQNLIGLPKISSQQLISPLSSTNAFVNYKFLLAGVFFENGQKIYNISVEPRFDQAPLFSGHLFIIDSIWMIKSMDLSINPGVMEFFKNFRIIQDYEEIDGRWIPVRREFVYTINDLNNVVMANTRVDHSNYRFNVDMEKKEFKNQLVTYADDAFDKDSLYWANTRPLSLKPEELAFIHQQDSINNVLTSDNYVDSVNHEFNRITAGDIFLNGVGFRSREKKSSIYIGSLISQPQFFGVGGYRHRIFSSYSKEFKNAHAIDVSGQIDYGFANKDLKGYLSIEYTFLPKHFGSFRISGGDVYDYVSSYQAISNVFSARNLVRKSYLGLSQRYELVNGLYARLSFDYSTRIAIDDLKLNPWMDSLFHALKVDNTPQPFETYTVSIAKIELMYRFAQKYVIKGGKKLIIGTQFPEISVAFRQGIPKLFSSDVNFSHAQIGVSDIVDFGTWGTFKWNAVSGTFFGKDLASIRFIEHKWFRSSDRLFFSNPLMSLQTLDLRDTTILTHTAKPYMELYAIHHFNGAITNKIPLINKLKIDLVVGGGALMMVESGFKQFEMYFGLERKIKIKRQLFKVAAFYVIRANSNEGLSVVKDPLLGFKIGLDFFNTWNNSWTW